MEILSIVIIFGLLLILGLYIGYEQRRLLKDRNRILKNNEELQKQIDSRRTNDEGKISFKETLDLTGLPIISFKIFDRKYNFILDTGSSASCIIKE